MNTILSSVIIGGVYAWEKTASPFHFSVREGGWCMDAEGVLVPLSRLRSIVNYGMKQNCITGTGILGNLQSCCNQYFYMKYRPCESGHCDKPTENCYARLQSPPAFWDVLTSSRSLFWFCNQRLNWQITSKIRNIFVFLMTLRTQLNRKHIVSSTDNNSLRSFQGSFGLFITYFSTKFHQHHSSVSDFNKCESLVVAKKVFLEFLQPLEAPISASICA